MQSFFLSLRSEFYKSRKSLAFWASILLPLIICGLASFGYLATTKHLPQMPPDLLWISYSAQIVNPMGYLILPFYVIFMAFSVNNIEHKNDTWKSLLSQPLNKLSIYTAKYLFAVILIFICLFLFGALTYLMGNASHLLKPGLRFNEFNPIELLTRVYLKLFLAALAMLSLQFIISLIWSDFLKPMGIGFIGIIFGIMMASGGWKLAYLFPYSLPVITMIMTKTSTQFFTREIWASLAYAVMLFTTGYLIVARKSIK